MDESKFIADGQALGFAADALLDYVDKRVEREEKRRTQEIEREERRQEREAKNRTLELEVQRAHEENEKLRVEAALGSGNSVNSGAPILEHKGGIKLAQFKEGEDISIYLKTFERVRDANKWSTDVALAALVNGFLGTKVSVFLDSLNNLEYAELKPQLIQSFGASIYDLQKKFRYTKQTKEPISQLVVVLEDVLSKICDMIQIGNDIEKLKQFVIKDQLLRSVSRNLADFLKENDLFKIELSEVVKISENFQAIHGISQNRYTEQKFSEPRKDFSKEADSRKCYACGELGHLSKFCKVKPALYSNPSESSEKTEHKSSRACYVCGDETHIAKFCGKKRGKFEKEVASISLSKNFNYGKNLPLTKGKCNGKQVNILRDTGSTTILVKPYLVKSSKMTGKKIELKFADGSTKLVPTGEIYLKSPYFSGSVIAACVEGLPFDVLVGNVDGASCACADSSDGKDMDSIENENINFVCSVQTRNQAKMENVTKKTNVGIGSIKLDMTEMSPKNLIKLQKEDETIRKCFSKM